MDGGTGVDASYDPSVGNLFEGPLDLDDERIRGIDPSALRAGTTPCREPILVEVYRIVDGDTFYVRGNTPVIDADVRFIGVNAPEIAHFPAAAECYGDAATTFTTQLLGHLVWLTFDNDCFDPYDRLLAYVHVGGGDGDLWQRQMLRRGFARVLTVGANRTFSSTFRSDEDFANMSSAGLWSACF